jgi:hypothetical protein
MNWAKGNGPCNAMDIVASLTLLATVAVTDKLEALYTAQHDVARLPLCA